MRFKFSRFYTDRVRIGRLLEMMDYVASTVAYKYAAKVDETKITVVTATVDNI
jgi:acyl-coenzyme A thioesterase 9